MNLCHITATLTLKSGWIIERTLKQKINIYIFEKRDKNIREKDKKQRVFWIYINMIKILLTFILIIVVEYRSL